MKSSGKRKLSLIGTIISSLVMVGTASVATFAWFTASAAASVQTSSTSADVTVSSPDDIHPDTVSVFMYHGADVSSKDVDDYDNDDPDEYHIVSTSSLRTINNFYPGDVLTFAIKVEAEDDEIINIGSMDLTYQAYHLINREISGDNTKVVTILSAINVSTGVSTDGTYPSMTNQLTPAARGGIAKSSLTIISSGDDVGKYSLTTPGSITNAINNASIGANAGYFFFTIKFINVPSTFYSEVDSSGKPVYTTKTDPTTRFFSGSNSGSSSCYENLNFNITKAAITVG